MNDFEHSVPNVDDPRLTAFALDELEGGERAQIEAAVAADPSLQAAVDDIRATAGQLTIALKAEPLPEPRRSVHIEPYHTVRPPRMFRFPYWAVAGLAAAACFAVVLALRDGSLFGTAAQRDAAKLARASEKTPAAIKAGSIGQRQPNNQLTVEFPKQDSVGDGQPSSAASGTLDQIGVVVPDPQEFDSNLPAAGLASSESAADAEGRLVAQDAEQGAMSGSAATHARGGPVAASARDADNDFIAAAQNPRSTFPVEVDTASYANVRRFLLDNRRPPRDAVRIDGLINSFTYGYAAPKPADRDQFAASLEAASAPWAPSHRLVRIGLKARDLPADHGLGEPGGIRAVIARDVNVQVEFNPGRVQAYRLIGYEDDGRKQENAGGGRFNSSEVSAGHSVTALYEVVPSGVAWKHESEAIALGYQTPAGSGPAGDATPRATGPDGAERIATTERAPKSGDTDTVSQAMLTVTVRYRVPDAGADQSVEFPLVDRGTAFADASSDLRFAAAVAGFGMVLRDSPHTATTRLADVLQWARQAMGSDPDHRRSEFISLVTRAAEILPARG